MTMAGKLDEFDALEREIGLHESLEVIYVVDGYLARLLGNDGNAVVREVTSPSLFLALRELAKGSPA